MDSETGRFFLKHVAAAGLAAIHLRVETQFQSDSVLSGGHH
jgi:hypothetical protein